MRVFANILSQQTQNGNDKECQYDYETYGINHNASKQEFQEPKAPEDFRKIEYYFEDFCESHEQLGIRGYSTSARIIHRGIQVTKNSRVVSSRDSRNKEEQFRASCNNKINGIECKIGKCV